MGKRPDLSELEKMFSKGIEFELTDAQYEKKTGIPLPKGIYYLKNQSALAKLVSKMDYSMEVIEKQVIFRKK